MEDVVGRGLVVVVVAALAVVVSRLGGGLLVRRHRPVDASSIGTRSGIIVFTATGCASCKRAILVARATGVPVREVTWELEPDRIERVGVTKVPFTVVVGERGQTLAQFAGVPSRRKLGKALSRLHP